MDRDRDQRQKSNKIYISNLSIQTKEDDLQKHFGDFGKITNVTLKQKDTGITFGFVQYENQRDAQRALEQMNHKQVDGKQLKVQYAKGGQRRFQKRNYDRGDRDRGDRDRDRSYRGGDRDRYDRGGPRRDNNNMSRGCYNCGKDGHFARQCQQPKRPRQFGGDRGGSFRGGDRDRGNYRRDRDDREKRYRKNSSDKSSPQRKKKKRQSSSDSR